MQRVRRDELLEGRERVPVSSGIEERARPELVREHVHARPLPGALVGPRLARELVQRRAAPQRERFFEQGQALVRVVDCRRRADRGLEPAGVQRVRAEVEDVSARAVGQGRPVVAEALPQLGHIGLDRRFRPSRGRLAPQGIHDAVERLRLADVREEVRQEAPAFRTFDLDRLTVGPHRERPEHTELQRHRHVSSPRPNRRSGRVKRAPAGVEPPSNDGRTRRRTLLAPRVTSKGTAVLFDTNPPDRLRRDLDVALFADCTNRELRRIDTLSTVIQRKAGHTLCRRGEIGGECFVLLEGEVDVDTNCRHYTVGPGSPLGEMALLISNGRRSATVTARTDITVLVFSRTEFNQLMRGLPIVAHKILNEAARRLVENTEALNTMA